MEALRDLDIRQARPDEYLPALAIFQSGLGTEAVEHIRACEVDLIVADDSNHLLGAATATRNPLHPGAWHAHLAVAPDRHRQGVGRELHQHLVHRLRKSDPAAPVDISCPSDAVEACQFVRALGYTLLNEVRELRVTAPPSGSKPLAGQIRTLAEFGADEGGLSTVIDFLLRRYREKHTWSPPDFTLAEVWNTIALEGVSPALSLVLNAPDIAAVCTVAPARKAEPLSVIWCFAKSNKDEPLILSALLAILTERAREQGLPGLELEVDSQDSALSATIAHWSTELLDATSRFRLQPERL